MTGEGDRAGSLQQWFTVLERYHPTSCIISDLIGGNSYSFRVFSENLCGLSASAASIKELAHIQKAGGSRLGTGPLSISAFSLVSQYPSLGASQGCPPAGYYLSTPTP